MGARVDLGGAMGRGRKGREWGGAGSSQDQRKMELSGTGSGAVERAATERDMEREAGVGR